MNTAQRTEIISRFARKEKDTGSAEVQVAILTARINELTGHLASHRKDYHTRLGLVKMVGKRRRMLAYLSRENVSRYNKVIADLGLRK